MKTYLTILALVICAASTLCAQEYLTEEKDGVLYINNKAGDQVCYFEVAGFPPRVSTSLRAKVKILIDQANKGAASVAAVAKPTYVLFDKDGVLRVTTITSEPVCFVLVNELPQKLADVFRTRMKKLVDDANKGI